MKIRITMKDPDTMHDAVSDAVEAELKAMDNLDDDDREALRETRMGKALDVTSQWFEYGEYLTIEVDTEAKTAIVIPRTR